MFINTAENDVFTPFFSTCSYSYVQTTAAVAMMRADSCNQGNGRVPWIGGAADKAL